MKPLIEPKCIICDHPLRNHLDDGEYYRCHNLGADGYQCECRIFKKIHQLKDLNKEKRINEAIKEQGIDKNRYEWMMIPCEDGSEEHLYLINPETLEVYMEIETFDDEEEE